MNENTEQVRRVTKEKPLQKDEILLPHQLHADAERLLSGRVPSEALPRWARRVRKAKARRKMASESRRRNRK